MYSFLGPEKRGDEGKGELKEEGAQSHVDDYSQQNDDDDDVADLE
jgi:hypothetical protein